jgi:hypothetical protein
LSEDIQTEPGIVLPMSVPEIRHVMGRLCFGAPTNPLHYWFWSLWRRVHQAIAKRCHYKRRLEMTTHLQL